MSLTSIAIRSVKPGNRSIRLFYVRGLYLEVSPLGGKWWRLKFRFEGKEKRLSLGVYPDVSLRDARERRLDALLDAARLRFWTLLLKRDNPLHKGLAEL